MRPLRFYEKNPTVKKAVETLMQLPDSARGIVSKGFCQIAEREFSAHLLIQDYRELGRERVLALYKSRLKRRPQDNEPYFHKAMNYLMVLTPDNQWFISMKLQSLCDMMTDYLSLCRSHMLPVQVAIAEHITDMYVSFGAVEAKEVITKVAREFHRIFGGTTEAGSIQAKADAYTFWIEADNGGMRLKSKLDFA